MTTSVKEPTVDPVIEAARQRTDDAIERLRNAIKKTDEILKKNS